MITLRLSALPPSVNELYTNIRGKGRVKTERYRSWIAAMGWDVNLARQEPIKGDIALELILGMPTNRKSDLSNRVKAIEDLLVRHGLIEDDSRVKRLVVEASGISGCLVTARAACA